MKFLSFNKLRKILIPQFRIASFVLFMNSKNGCLNLRFRIFFFVSFVSTIRLFLSFYACWSLFVGWIAFCFSFVAKNPWGRDDFFFGGGGGGVVSEVNGI